MTTAQKNWNTENGNTRLFMLSNKIPTLSKKYIMLDWNELTEWIQEKLNS